MAPTQANSQLEWPPHYSEITAPGLSIGRGGLSGRREIFISNRVAGEDQLHAAIGLTAFRSVIGGDGLRLAEAAGLDGACRDSLLHKIFAYSLGATLGELLIV